MPPPNKRKARVLRNVRVDEISAVDKGAGEGVHIMMMKRASRNEAFAKAIARLAASVKSIVAHKDKQMKEKFKSLDVVKICKQISDDGDAYSLSEHQLVEMIDEYARAHDTTFVRMFERTDEVGLALRKAITIAKQAQWSGGTATIGKAATLQPRVVGGVDARSVDSPRAALDQLNELVAQQRRANPTLSEAQAFEQVYTNPANRALAEQERKENRPRASW
jgi:hypothetical protein